MKFTKIAGIGNDFILFDNRNYTFSGKEQALFSKLCQRRISVGADGVILLENSHRADFKYRHFNADGSIAEMCGNGARAICYYAVSQKIAPPHCSFEIEGILHEAVVSKNNVRLKLPSPDAIDTKFKIVTEKFLEEGGFVRVGVPHLVIFVTDLASIDVPGIGRYYRHHARFLDGANVNFTQIIDSNTIQIRTYERGVEAETLACGTGSIAAAIIASQVKNLNQPVTVKNPGGTLQVSWDENFSSVYLHGKASIIYEGELKS